MRRRLFNFAAPLLPDLPALPPAVRKPLLREWHRRCYRSNRFWLRIALLFMASVGVFLLSAWLSHLTGIQSLTAYGLCLSPLFALAVFLPIYLPMYRRYLMSRLTDLRFCTRCCYDLTGNASGVCPECGTPVVKAGTEQ